MVFQLLKFSGFAAGVVLFCLPSLLLLRRERGLTEEEWRAQLPHRAWVVKAVPGCLLLMFLSFGSSALLVNGGR
jgi:hypothetical protein